MRVAGWNVHFTAGERPSLFAGIYQPPSSDIITFAAPLLRGAVEGRDGGIVR